MEMSIPTLYDHICILRNSAKRKGAEEEEEEEKDEKENEEEDEENEEERSRSRKRRSGWLVDAVSRMMG